jgi:hypothetical protein
MKWVKIGKIFDPREHKLPNNCIEFAQSPQALVFENFVRIYFSTRQRDKHGKFLSHIAFVDFDKTIQNIINISSETVIKLGKLGCYDEHGIFPFNVLQDEDKIYGYIGGWTRRVAVSVETSIGLAYSHDHGLTFHRVGDGPVLTSSLYEPLLVGDPFVAKFDNLFHMWYIYGTKWVREKASGTPERVYKIGYAISDDGIIWNKKNKQIITDALNPEECQALPSVIKYAGTYHMVFCFREATDFRRNKNRGYRLGYAFSEDLGSWIRDDSQVGIDFSEDGWDSEMLCYPHIFHCDDKVYLLYNGNEFGRYGFGLAILEA